MKKTHLILILIFSNLIYSQTKKFTGIIKDVTTLLPIDYVHISFNNENNSNGTISNELGEFSFSHNSPEVIPIISYK